MRVVIVSAAVGGLFGAAAATFIALHEPAHAAAASPPVLASAVPVRPVLIPPGWDPRLLSALSSVDARVSSLENAVASAAPADPEPVELKDTAEAAAARNAEIVQQYRVDLETQTKKLSDHDRERLDSSWATAQSASIKQAYEGAVDAAHPLSVERVDCRDTTCVADIAYATPADALADRATLRHRVRVSTCHGSFSALPPPIGPGKYTVTLIYDCR